MDDWNKPFTDEELVAVEAAFEAAAASSTASSSSLQLKTLCTSSSARRRHTGSASGSKTKACLASYSASFYSTPCFKKWPFRQEQRMELHGRSKKRLLEQHVCSSTVRLQTRRPRVVPMAVEEASMARKWDEMDHDILVSIMKYLVKGSYSTQAFTLYKPFIVCKAWRSAMLDSLFPPGNVLDLNFFQVVPNNERRYYQFYLKFLLQRPHQYTKLYFPECQFRDGADTYIAQRLPTLKCVVHLTPCLPFTISHLVPYWPELNEAHCHAALIRTLSKHCKYIRRLDLCGYIGDDIACRLASHFTQLMHLSIQSCILSPNALSIILQGRPDLTYLDTRHAFCIKGRLHGPIKGRVIEWDEDEVRQKAVGVKTYLHCTRKYCSYCAPLYSPNVSREVLCRFNTM